MKRILLFVLVTIIFTKMLSAQTLKTEVLVIGKESNAWAAGLQAAVSGVKATILLQDNYFKIECRATNVHSGIEAEFLKRLRKSKNLDSMATVSVDQEAANKIIKAWAYNTKNLSIIKDIKYVKLNKSGSNWSVALADGRTIKTKVLIYAGKEGDLAALHLPTPISERFIPLTYKENTYRTSIGSGHYLEDRSTTASFTTLSMFLLPAYENLILISDTKPGMLTGQVAGAVAAYAAFFKTKVSEANLKKIQGELLNYKLALMPFTDVLSDDFNWRAMQNVGLMGVVKAEIKEGKALFLPDQNITFAEIKAPLEGLYYRAQIWFDDHPNVSMTLENTISLVCYAGNKSLESTKSAIEKKWNTAYKFSGVFDLQHILSRREFAVIVNEYSQPFDVNVDKTGRIIR